MSEMILCTDNKIKKNMIGVLVSKSSQQKTGRRSASHLVGYIQNSMERMEENLSNAMLKKTIADKSAN